MAHLIKKTSIKKLVLMLVLGLLLVFFPFLFNVLLPDFSYSLPNSIRIFITPVSTLLAMFSLIAGASLSLLSLFYCFKNRETWKNHIVYLLLLLLNLLPVLVIIFMVLAVNEFASAFDS